MKQAMWVAALAVLGATGTGCAIRTNDEDRFREPIPQGNDVLLKVPGSTASSGGTSAQSAPIHLLGAGTSPSAGGSAQYYAVTRNLADGVDWGTLLTVGAVWLVAQTTPTSTSAHQAVWGPSRGDALSPVSWKLTVTESQADVFDYELDGRPAQSTSDADWKAVLTGHGYAKSHAQHGTGWFQWDADAQRALDPARAPHDTGTTKVTYDVHAIPATLHVDHAPTAPGESSYAIDVTHEAGGAGQVDVVGKGDVEAIADGNLESVDLHSRWDATGAGRADADVSGGDMPASVKSVHATECWDGSFARVYYSDTATTQPTTGSASACVFPQVVVPLPN